MIIKDAMVLIHLAKLSILEKSCDYFKKVLVPELVYDEIKSENYPDSEIIKKIIATGKIKIKLVENKSLIKKANEFNIRDGEAQALALYWQEKANLLATDDDNVRSKKELLEIKIIGTPSIILKLYKEKRIDKEKLNASIEKLREIGWFSNALLDSIILEVNKNE